ncbi:hypothetical protein DFJ58DRAFT_844032 [Suillus subalutaceus]|uniref:uncharacterized protein n=1 Tax=Suillus subalutaceus TaxID=48586 RepID=UPI001B865C30|nr:uncharacterized protein DFJ58DRAFT_844032 [Suillus subalutaceus]KAG1844540.1 hypothetical protein DFJ58DRAFT_844032 [Suillus subalutaceus]
MMRDLVFEIIFTSSGAMESHNITEIVGDLTKAELVTVVPANTLRANIQKQTWPQIMDVRKKMRDVRWNTRKAERKRITNKLQCDAQKSVEEVDFEKHSDGVADEHDYSKYLGLPSEEEIKKCFKAYISGMSNGALAMSICIVCGQELMSSEGYQTSGSGFLYQWKHYLRQQHYGRDYCCLKDMLKERHLMQQAGSVVNDTRHANPSHLQWGMVGNVTLYDMNTDEVAKMVKGQFLPQPVTSLASVLTMMRLEMNLLDEDIPNLENDSEGYSFGENSSDSHDAHVIPLKFLGVTDAELSTLPLNDLMKHALMNLDDGVTDNEGGYVVRHSHYPVSDFGCNQIGGENLHMMNPLAMTYPKLFPYGVGGIEDTHGKERRGRTQKDIQSSGFNFFRNMCLQCLGVSWDLIIIKVNIAGLYGEHVFAGEQIDMDEFFHDAGLDSNHRAQNIARDPFAATKYFFFIIKAVLSTLFQIEVRGNRVHSGMGMLGRVSGYFGVIEAQGRGLLHMHMMIWLRHTPNMHDMHAQLQNGEFHTKIKEYIQQNIRAHVEGLDEETI